MGIRPADLGLMVQRTTEVDRVQHVKDQQNTTAQEQFGIQMKEELEKREIQVKSTPGAAQAKVDPDAQKEREKRQQEAGHGHAGAGDGSEKRGQDGQGLQHPPTPGDHFDIRI